MSDGSENDKTTGASGPDRKFKMVAVVQCEGFRCLAYRDGEIWRDFKDGKELPEVKGIVETFFP